MGPYRLEKPLGQGGMGSVWRAWDERLKRQVALKRFRPDVEISGLRERFLREARATAALKHPSIVHIYDIVEQDSDEWIVMELVEGETLERLLRIQKTLPVSQILDIGRQIAEGLAEAHAHGILHRDLKLSNVMVNPAGHVKLLDFGLAKRFLLEEESSAPDEQLSRPGMLLGTVHAMSPEQVQGHTLDARSDLFSFGSLLYGILTGLPPFHATTSLATLVQILSHEPRPIAEVRPEVPPELSDL
ncbi:MAG TPA: serine/threonine-protein kinase, partial [Thermoanaerobaculia bacterium]|nr:serine/threonine-protein kinase [Thermoanaerobaculia bacterium]